MRRQRVRGLRRETRRAVPRDARARAPRRSRDGNDASSDESSPRGSARRRRARLRRGRGRVPPPRSLPVLARVPRRPRVSGAYSLHWSPYDRNGVVNAVPEGLCSAHLSAHPSRSIPDLDAFQLQLTPFNSTPTFARMERPSVSERLPDVGARARADGRARRRVRGVGGRDRAVRRVD